MNDMRVKILRDARNASCDSSLRNKRRACGVRADRIQSDAQHQKLSPACATAPDRVRLKIPMSSLDVRSSDAAWFTATASHNPRTAAPAGRTGPANNNRVGQSSRGRKAGTRLGDNDNDNAGARRGLSSSPAALTSRPSSAPLPSKALLRHRQQWPLQPARLRRTISSSKAPP